MPSIKRSSLGLLGVLLCGVVWNQCLTSIPASAVIISQTSDATIDGNDGTYWVCPQAYHQVFLGDNNTLFVEDGAIIGVMGNNNAIFYRSNNNALGLYGDNNIISVNSLENIIDNGLQNTVYVCGSNGITFDLTDAPDPGCLSTGIADDLATVQIVRIERSQNLLLVHASSVVHEVIICDAQGRIAQYASGPHAGALDIAALAPGWYVARIRTGTGSSVHRFSTF